MLEVHLDINKKITIGMQCLVPARLQHPHSNSSQSTLKVVITFSKLSVSFSTFRFLGLKPKHQHR